MTKSQIYREHPARLKQFWRRVMVSLWGEEKQVSRYDYTMSRVLIYGTLLRRYGIQPRGVIYAGAHQGSLLWTWLTLGFRNILMIEPQQESFEVLQRAARLSAPLCMVYDALLSNEEPAQILLAQCAIGDRNDETTLFVMSCKDLTSLKEPNPDFFGTHDHAGMGALPRQEATLVEQKRAPLRTLDSLLQDYGAGPGAPLFNVLYMNIQGSELDALRGATKTLESIEFIYLENNYVERYRGLPTVEQLDTYLGDFGFEAKWGMTQPTLGNGFTAYVKRPHLHEAPRGPAASRTTRSRGTTR